MSIGDDSVYFAKVGRYIKVGYSKHPVRRVANLWRSQTRYTRPYDLSVREEPELLLTIDGDKHDEQVCHQMLEDYWSNGEWFIDEPGVREFMASAKRGKFPRVTRPDGPFVAVPWQLMLEERRAETDAYIERVRARKSQARTVLDQIFADHAPRREAS